MVTFSAVYRLPGMRPITYGISRTTWPLSQPIIIVIRSRLLEMANDLEEEYKWLSNARHWRLRGMRTDCESIASGKRVDVCNRVCHRQARDILGSYRLFIQYGINRRHENEGYLSGRPALYSVFLINRMMHMPLNSGSTG